MTSTKYLGLIIIPGGLAIDLEKVKTIIDWLLPGYIRDL